MNRQIDALNFAKNWNRRNFLTALLAFGIFPAKLCLCGNVSSAAELENEKVPSGLAEKSAEILILNPSRFENPEFEEISSDERLEFERMRQNLENELWEEGLRLLRKFLLLTPEKCLPASLKKLPDLGTLSVWNEQILYPANSEPVNQLCVGTECAGILMELPAEGRRRWCSLVDSSAGTSLKNLAVGHDFFLNAVSLTELNQIRCANLFSSFEAEFLELLGQIAWREGKLTAAQGFWKEELLELKRWDRLFSGIDTENASAVKKENADSQTSGREAQTAVPPTVLLPALPEVSELVHRLELLEESLKEQKNQEKQKEQKGQAAWGRAVVQNARTLDERGKSQKDTDFSDWRVSMTQISDSADRVIFEDFLPLEQRGTLFQNRERNEELEHREIPQFRTFSKDGKLLAARLGTLVSFWPPEERETRPQAYAVVLDLSREGVLCMLAVPDSPQRVLAGNVLLDEEFLYVPTLYLGERLNAALDVYSLADGTLTARKPLFQADFPKKQEVREKERLSVEGENSVFLPIRWTEDGKILIGGPDSGVQILCVPEK